MLHGQGGCEAKHVVGEGLLRAGDRPIWGHAGANGQIIVSKDEDFPKLKILEPAGPQVVWLRVGNCTNDALLAWFTPLLPDIIRRLKSGEGIIEVI